MTWNLSKVIWAWAGAPGDERRRHVHADLRHGVRRSAVLTEIFGKAADRVATLPLGGEQDTRLVEVHEERDIVVAALACRLVDPDRLDAREVGRITRFLDVVMNHAPEPGVILVDHPPDRGHGHLAGESHD
jgi:hypothetical protein